MQGSSLIYYVEIILSVLFDKIVAKSTKNGVMRGSAPPPRPF